MTKKIKIYPNLNKNAAFSLVEMLMALLVASLLMAALAPVMTKKLNESLDINGTYQFQERKFCGVVNDTYENKEETCTVPPDVQMANAIIVSGGGGGAGAVDYHISTDFFSVFPNEGLFNAESSNFNDGRRQEFELDEYVEKLSVFLVGGGGGGGGGHYVLSGFKPVSQVDCEPFGVYIPAEYNDGNSVCISKYNPGESHTETDASPAVPITTVTGVDLGGGPTSSVTVKRCTAGDFSVCNKTYCSNSDCCYFAQSGAPTGALVEGTDNRYTYDVRYRTVCQWKAAAAICKSWKPSLSLLSGTAQGRLPKKSESDAWQASGILDDIGSLVGKYNLSSMVINSSGSTALRGLQLCNYVDGSGASFASNGCNSVTNCFGARNGDNYCFPGILWLGDYAGTASDGFPTYHVSTMYRNKYILFGNGNFSHQAFSVRCAIGDGTFTSYSGGGGGSGVHIAVKVHDDAINYLRKNGGGKLIVYPGYGGKGGSALNGTPAVDGTPSRAEIVDKSGKVIWAVQVNGGKAGTNGTTSAYGKGGAAIENTSPVCSYQHLETAGGDGSYETLKNINCLAIPGYIAVNSGLSGYDGNASQYASYGALNQSWDSSLVRTEPGKTGNGYGTGGGGSICAQTSYRNVSCAQGGSGGRGRITFTYRRRSPGLGGAGGGAGAVLHTLSIPVVPNSEITIKAGKKGKGGSSGAKGGDGGDSYIKIGSTEYKATGGKGAAASIRGNGGTLTTNVTLPVPGAAGAGGKVDSNIKGTKVNGGDGTAIVNSTLMSSGGGNGGVNFKTSQYAPIPCGGLNTEKITMGTLETDCSEQNPLNTATLLTRTLTKNDFSSTFISTLAAGATGGGGGGWDASAAVRAASGADGLGGYVFIYFKGW